jgi:bacillithiol synthase
MKYSCSHLPYQSTGYFSNLVTHYLQQTQQLQQFYQHSPNIDGIKNAIKNKALQKINRPILVQYFNEVYNTQNSSIQQKQHIELLKQENCFTITTAHQPNIFTGPLYFIYKILHTIKLAQELNTNLPQYKFVPVYYMGSEDADLDELGNITLQQKKITWHTQQTGAVGRMKVDAYFIKLIDEIEAQIAVNTFGKELIAIFRTCYQLNNSIQHSTFNLVNTLFSKYGLLVLNPDNTVIKKQFIDTIQKELIETFSAKEVANTVEQLNKWYKIKATGRDINLFYLIDDNRERIEQKNELFIVQKLNLQFTLPQIIEELNNYPERFSPNVILRPLLQETILPNAAFIGGGGEMAYWLQLKNVFAKVNIPFPVLLLRNSFLLYKQQQLNKLQNMNITIDDLFIETNSLFSKFVTQQTQNNISLSNTIATLNTIYNQLQTQVNTIDATLVAHTKALKTKALKQITQLEKKLLQAEKRKFETQRQQLIKIKNDLFYNNNLQERTENFSYLYSIYGNQLFDIILNCSSSFKQEFALINIDAASQTI